LWHPSDQSGISTTCDGPHVTRDTHVGLVARGCPHGWLGCSVRCLALSLACPSTTDFAEIWGCCHCSLEKCTGTFLAVSTFECSPTCCGSCCCCCSCCGASAYASASARCHCHGVNLAVIVAPSAIIAAAVGGGKNSHDCIINFAGAIFKSKVTPEYIKDQRQQNSAGARQKICMILSLSHTKNDCRSPRYYFVVCRNISIPTWKEPF
jgi:hypothetical protein